MGCKSVIKGRKPPQSPDPVAWGSHPVPLWGRARAPAAAARSPLPIAEAGAKISAFLHLLTRRCKREDFLKHKTNKIRSSGKGLNRGPQLYL